MVARAPSYLKWLNSLVLIGFAWLAILIELTPLNEEAKTMLAPDLLFCVAAFLVLRRPSATPAFLIVIFGLARDLLGGGPVGLGALALVAAIECLRALGEFLSRRNVFFEFGAVAVFSFLLIVLQTLGLLITFSHTPPLDQLASRVFGTFLAYLLIYVFFRWVLRVRGEFAADNRLPRKAA
jgi:rod shape-determining protein MreD